MTIIYQFRVATTSLGGFLKLLGIWRGSVYKLLYKETMIFAMLYSTISLTYRLFLSPSQKIQMERVVIHCNSYTNFIPISFVLGFYVTIVVQRWWQQFKNVPWPDRTLFVLCTYLNGQEERSRIMRRSVVRYMMFGLLLIMRSVSLAVMKRFPTIDTIVEAGFITKEEAETYETTQCRYLKFWVPLMWANNIIARARREGRIETEFGLRMVLEQLADFRDKCSLCFVYDWITIPLVYTQVVTLAVYSFFAACLLGRQFLDTSKGYPGYEYDSYVPVFTLLQFTFYMGWLKVAEQMINPFGEDDDDYDINWLLDRHMAVAFALVDQCCGRHPPLIRDHFWDEAVMPEMPYTEASQSSRRANFLGSSFNINHLSSEDQRIISPPDSDRLRRRSHGSFAGSVLSLFSFRPHNSLLSGSRDTIDSGEQYGRYLHVPNGRSGYVPVPQITVSKSRSVSLDMSNTEEALRMAIPERRERSNSERVENTEKGLRVRKLSSPSRFNFLANRDNQKEPASPKPSRFSVEPVDDSCSSVHQSEAGEGGVTRTRRSGQHTLAVLQAVAAGGSKAVSRPPLLSAIEEGNTVTSLRQLLPRSDSQDTASVVSTDDLFSDFNTTTELEDISEDHRELEFTADASVTPASDVWVSSAVPHAHVSPAVPDVHVSSGVGVSELAPLLPALPQQVDSMARTETLSYSMPSTDAQVHTVPSTEAQEYYMPSTEAQEYFMPSTSLRSVPKVFVPEIHFKSAPCDQPNSGQLASDIDTSFAHGAGTSLSVTSFPNATLPNAAGGSALMMSAVNNQRTCVVGGQVASVSMAEDETRDQHAPVSTRPLPTIVIEEY